MKKKLSGIHLKDLPLNKRKDKRLLGADRCCRLPLTAACDETDLTRARLPALLPNATQ